MKSIYTILLFLFIAAGCSKGGSSSTIVTPPTPVTEVPGVVVTPSNATTNAQQSVWHLTDLAVNNTARTLTSQQSAFVMVLSVDHRYSDTDGVLGTWSSPAADSIVVMQTNLPTTIQLRYKIQSKTTTRLSMTMGSGASQINLGYEAR
jgi:uncharacterized lipoprotein YajG